MLDFAACERARLARDPAADGKFYVAVKTTGVYCRPVCPSRPALSKNVQYFETREEVAARGYRACKRCRPALPR
jgi:AraC family transcriptional regulator of adaptative response / DNA-3-methyladenine glycosylase II